MHTCAQPVPTQLCSNHRQHVGAGPSTSPRPVMLTHTSLWLDHNRSGRVGTVFLGTRALYKRRAHKKGAADTTDRPTAPAGSPLTPRAERTADRAAPAGSVQPTQRCNNPTMPPLCQPTTRSTSGPKAKNIPNCMHMHIFVHCGQVG